MHPSLVVTLCKGLTLASPVMVASCHFTDSEAGLKHWAPIEPSALTLKTTSSEGGSLEESRRLQRNLYPLTADLLNKDPHYGLSLYSDGPKKKELLTPDATVSLLSTARNLLPKTKIGVSILAGEDFSSLRQLAQKADYLELNTKYSMREPKNYTGRISGWTRKSIDELLQRLHLFIDTFPEKPKLIKLTREMNWLTRKCKERTALLRLCSDPSIAIVLANTERQAIPIVKGTRVLQVYEQGVLSGEALFTRTFQLVREIAPLAHQHGIRVVATGGAVTPDLAIQLINSGAAAVQICTGVQYYGHAFHHMVTEKIAQVVSASDSKNFEEYTTIVHSGRAIVGIPSPFDYLPAFREASDRVERLISESRDLHIVAMTFRRLLEDFPKAFRTRFSRPGTKTTLVVPSADSEVLTPIAKAWGIPERTAKQYHARIDSAVEELIDLYEDTRISKGTEPCSRLAVYRHKYCPFYSFYVTDTLAWECPYPFDEDTGPSVPILQFDRSHPEYERLADQLQRIIKSKHTILDYDSTEVIATFEGQTPS